MPELSEPGELIAFIAPNPVVAKSMVAALKDLIVQNRALVYVINMNDLRGELRRLKARRVGAIVARGGTYYEIEQLHPDIPLVKSCISTLDVLVALQQVERQKPAGPVYLLLNQQTEFYEDICHTALNMPFEYHPFDTPEDLRCLVQRFSATPGAMFVGSGLTAELVDLPEERFVNIVMNASTLRSYYNQAVALVEHLRKEVDQLNQTRATLSQIAEGVIVLDSLGNIHEVTQKSLDILQAAEDEVLGRSIKTVLPAFPFQFLLGKPLSEQRHKAVKINGTMVDVTISSFYAYQTRMRYLVTLQKVSTIQKLEQDIRFDLTRRGLVAKHRLEDIKTQNPAMLRLIDKARTLADYDGSILFYGESGTGKEMFAQGVHNSSARSGGPFVAVNCAALSETLLESEMFGYVGGAFTGARKEGKAGLFELAHGGTIFLDEINSMSLNLQSKLLRVLEEQAVMRIGSDYVIPLDVRVLSAANKNLLRSVQNGSFRGDLYYRLNAFELYIPPLRERADDILLLFRFYVARQTGVPLSSVSLPKAFAQQLLAYEWPGNVRELRSTALRYVTFDGDNADGDILRPTPDAPRAPLVNPGGHIDLNQLSHTVEQLVVQNLLEQGLKKSDVARMLGISRQALYKKMNGWTPEGASQE